MRNFLKGIKVVKLSMAKRSALAIFLGVAILLTGCSGSKKAEDSTPSSTSVPEALSPNLTTIATAKGEKIRVLTSLPAGTSTSTTIADSAISPTTTAVPGTPVANLPAIPRKNLNSAGVRVVDGGYEYDNPTYYKNPLVFQVLEQQGAWLKVLLPARPNHQTGWVETKDVTLSFTNYRVQLDLSTYTVRVFQDDSMVFEAQSVIGLDRTKTPTGHFYITEKIPQNPTTGIYGTWVVATNGYSDSIDLFNGGLPVIAFHGTNEPKLIGTKASNGCVRMSNDSINWIAERLPAGTPIDIYATTPSWWTPVVPTTSTVPTS
jgi:lipoprotein-anchoring transpeptidase ErfK/SrfK